jgi:hypothetical protein
MTVGPRLRQLHFAKTFRSADRPFDSGSGLADSIPTFFFSERAAELSRKRAFRSSPVRLGTELVSVWTPFLSGRFVHYSGFNSGRYRGDGGGTASASSWPIRLGVGSYVLISGLFLH